jgi:hypothetical protein
MSPAFIPRFDILPAPQRRLWAELAAVTAEFVLYGGTAIALHLGHRQSVDAKDYIDIDALLTDGRVDLPMALAAGRAIYGTSFNSQNTLKALAYFDDGTLRRLSRPLKDRLTKAVCAVDLDRLPVIVAPDPGGAR